MQVPPIADWWPLLWATDIGQYARPMSCPALAAFEWSEVSDAVHEPVGGWDRWERTVNNQRIFVPTLQTVINAIAGTAPWLP
eukprot:9181387-Pyramimonas_sp.AAC.1